MIIHSDLVMSPGEIHQGECLADDGDYKKIAIKIIRLASRDELENFIKEFAPNSPFSSNPSSTGSYYYEIEVLD